MEENYAVEGDTVKLVVENCQSFRLIKKDAETKLPLANVKFAIYNIDNDEEEVAKDSRGEIVGTLETINGKEYYVVTTDSNGEITVDLPSGLYKAVEVEAPEQYKIENSVYYFGIGTSREGEEILVASDAVLVGNSSLEEGIYYTNISDVEATEDGGIISVGYFYGTINIGNFKLVSDGINYDGFIVKYDENRNVSWAKSIGGNADVYITSVEENNNGEIAVGGYCNGTVNIGENTIGILWGYNGLVIKYDSNGNVIWGKTVVNDTLDEARGIHTISIYKR